MKESQKFINAYLTPQALSAAIRPPAVNMQHGRIFPPYLTANVHVWLRTKSQDQRDINTSSSKICNHFLGEIVA
jgi:hypothetical protein